MNKFSYLDYRTLIRDLLMQAPGKVRGQQTRLAHHMGVHTTFLTHVLGEKNDLSAEQSLKVANYFSMSSLETDYFLTLVHVSRAGDESTRLYFEKKLNEIRAHGLALKEQLKKTTQMDPAEQAVFYSDWTYSAVRLATALPQGQSVERIAKLLGLSTTKVGKIVDFLIQAGLCEFKDGRLTYRVFSTYADSSSPFAKKLHDNWRLRSIQMGTGDAEDLMYTSAVTLTKSDFLALRDVLLATLKKFEKVTDDSEPRLLAYLSLDWLKVTDG